jgi:hypothetical protein
MEETEKVFDIDSVLAEIDETYTSIMEMDVDKSC